MDESFLSSDIYKIVQHMIYQLTSWKKNRFPYRENVCWETSIPADDPVINIDFRANSLSSIDNTVNKNECFCCNREWRTFLLFPENHMVFIKSRQRKSYIWEDKCSSFVTSFLHFLGSSQVYFQSWFYLTLENSKEVTICL